MLCQLYNNEFVTYKHFHYQAKQFIFYQYIKLTNYISIQFYRNKVTPSITVRNFIAELINNFCIKMYQEMTSCRDILDEK